MELLDEASPSSHSVTPRREPWLRGFTKPSVSTFFTGPEELEDSSHSEALLAQLKTFYEERLLCDVTIEVVTSGSSPGTGRLFPCNRSVLAAACPYFKSMFTSGMYESQQAKVTMHGVDPEAFEVLVGYCYTGRVSLSEANVQRLYVTSDMLQLEYVREACASFLARRLDLTNCTAVFKFADAFEHHKLRSEAQAFIAHNFKQLSQMSLIREETLADLTLAQLLAVLRLDTLDIESERTVCHVAMQWLEAAPKERGPSATEVLKCVRWMHFAEKDRDYLEGLLTKPIVRKHCLDVVEGALQMCCGDVMYKSLVPKPNSSTSSIVSSSENPPQRMGMCAKEMVIFFGHPSDPFLCYDPYSGDVYRMPSPLTSLARRKNIITAPAVCVSPDHDIYLAAQPRKDLWVYKPAHNSWQQLADRLLCRVGMHVAYAGGYVYILGGRDPVTGIKLKDVECYSVQRNQWVLVEPLPHSFLSFDLVVVQNCLYAVSSKRMYCFDPNRNMWLKCKSLKWSSFQEACVFNDEIYCVCDIAVLKVFSPFQQEWRQMRNMPLVPNARNYQLIKHCQKLLLISLHTQQWRKNQVTVFEYNTAEDRWFNIGSSSGLFHFDSPFFCVSARVFPPCLEPAQSSLAQEEEQSSAFSAERNTGGGRVGNPEPASSSYSSDDDFWI